MERVSLFADSCLAASALNAEKRSPIQIVRWFPSSEEDADDLFTLVPLASKPNVYCFIAFCTHNSPIQTIATVTTSIEQVAIGLRFSSPPPQPFRGGL